MAARAELSILLIVLAATAHAAGPDWLHPCDYEANPKGCEKVSVNHGVLVATHLFGFLALAMFSGFFYYYAHRGSGFKNRPFDEIIPRNEFCDIGAIVTGFAACVYLLRACHYVREDNGDINIAKYPYLDYVFTCPLIILDITYSADIPHKAFAVVITFATLLVGCLASQSSDKGERMLLFAMACLICLGLFAHTLYFMQKNWVNIPKVAQSSLWWAMFFFFSMWSMFPTFYLLYFEAHAISFEVWEIVQMILDVLAKGVHGVFLTRFRLHMEDIEAEDHEAAKKAEEAGNMSPSSPMRSKRQQNAMLSSRYMMVQIRSSGASQVASRLNSGTTTPRHGQDYYHNYQAYHHQPQPKMGRDVLEQASSTMRYDGGSSKAPAYESTPLPRSERKENGHDDRRPSAKKRDRPVMKCGNCMEPLDPNAKFCFECGTKVKVRSDPTKCAGCSEPLPPNSKFCIECGLQVGARQLDNGSNGFGQAQLDPSTAPRDNRRSPTRSMRRNEDATAVVV